MLFYMILPKKDKFKETLLNRVYYDMLRIYANELDKENTLLITNGFSFDDEHILDITKRALKKRKRQCGLITMTLLTKLPASSTLPMRILFRSRYT